MKFVGVDPCVNPIRFDTNVGVDPCVNSIVVSGKGRHADLPLQCDQNVGVDLCVNTMENLELTPHE